MKIYLFIIILGLSTISNAKNKNDSNGRKYSLEWGFHSSYFISKRVDNNFNNQWLFYPLISSIGLGYQIDKSNKVSFLASWYLNYKLGNENSVKIFGDVSRIDYYLGAIGYQREFYTHTQFNYHYMTSINWRYGTEYFFNYQHAWEANELHSVYNSFGLGLGGGINYKIKNRTFINLDLTFNHFFEKSSLSTTSFLDYKPIRNLVVGNLKFGILL